MHTENCKDGVGKDMANKQYEYISMKQQLCAHKDGFVDNVNSCEIALEMFVIIESSYFVII